MNQYCYLLIQPEIMPVDQFFLQKTQNQKITSISILAVQVVLFLHEIFSLQIPGCNLHKT
jgi:hypothetical protein